MYIFTGNVNHQNMVHLGSKESTKEARVAYRYCIKQLILLVLSKLSACTITIFLFTANTLTYSTAALLSYNTETLLTYDTATLHSTSETRYLDCDSYSINVNIHDIIYIFYSAIRSLLGTKYRHIKPKQQQKTN